MRWFPRRRPSAWWSGHRPWPCSRCTRYFDERTLRQHRMEVWAVQDGPGAYDGDPERHPVMRARPVRLRDPGTRPSAPLPAPAWPPTSTVLKAAREAVLFFRALRRPRSRPPTVRVPGRGPALQPELRQEPGRLRLHRRPGDWWGGARDRGPRGHRLLPGRHRRGDAFAATAAIPRSPSWLPQRLRGHVGRGDPALFRPTSPRRRAGRRGGGTSCSACVPTLANLATCRCRRWGTAAGLRRQRGSSSPCARPWTAVDELVLPRPTAIASSTAAVKSPSPAATPEDPPVRGAEGAGGHLRRGLVAPQPASAAPIPTSPPTWCACASRDAGTIWPRWDARPATT
jgi:hypothetical protein